MAAVPVPPRLVRTVNIPLAASITGIVARRHFAADSELVISSFSLGL